MTKFYIKTKPSEYIKYFNISLLINPTSVWINDAKFEKSDFLSTLIEFIDFSAEEKRTILHLNFNENNLYQDYLFYKSLLGSITNEAIFINPIEFIYDTEKVPDCGCE